MHKICLSFLFSLSILFFSFHSRAQAPVINCPANISVVAVDQFPCGRAVVCFADPTGSDANPPLQAAGFGAFTAYNGHYYAISTGMATHSDAAAACRAAGGHLVNISDAGENAFVHSLAPDGNWRWIGLSDSASEGTYVWQGGCGTPAYTNWGSGEPNNYGGNEDAAIMWSGGTWADVQSDLSVAYFLEVDGVKMYQTAGPVSGSSFFGDPGATTITYKAVNASGLQTFCSFTVSVQESPATPPSISCPGTQTIVSCTPQVVTYSYPTATDNCTVSPTITQIAGFASGAVFPVGTTVNTFRATDASGNSSTCSFNVIITGTPNAVATPASQTKCSGTSITPIILSSSTSGVSYNWIRNNTASVTGIAASGSGNISGTLTNNTNSPVTVSFSITPTAPGCLAAGTPITANVLVDPIPNAIATPSSQNICNSSAITPIVLSGAVSGTTYNWTRDNTAGVTGVGSSGSGNISGILTNNTTAAITVTFTITPVYGSCAGTPITATVQVFETPIITPVTQTICSGTAINPLIMQGANMNWTRDHTADVTGIAANGSNTVSGTLTNTTTAPITVTFTATVSAGCTGPQSMATVIVNPIPNAVATPSSGASCNGSAINPIVLSGAVSGTIYNWTRDNTSGVTGIGSSGSGNISGTLTNNTTAPITVTFTITPTHAGCAGTPITATEQVFETPIITPVSQSVCSGTAISGLIMQGANMSWTRDHTADVTGIAASGTGSINGTLINTTNAPITVTFTATVTAGCPGPPSTATVIVYPSTVAYWIGGSSTAWEDAANWACHVLPTLGTDVVLSAGSGNVFVNSAATCRTLFVSPGVNFKVVTGGITIAH